MAEETLEAIKQVIRQRSDLFEKNFGAADAAKLVADYYVQAPIMSTPDAPVFRGREAIANVFNSLFNDFAKCRLVQHFVEMGGGLAYEMSSAHLLPKAGGDEIECRYLIVWRKCSDTWRVEADFFAYGKLL